MTALVASASTLSLPGDLPRVLALGVAVAAAWLVPRWLGSRRAAQLLVPVSALGAALLSAGYVAFYLRGGPRIIDATSYWLQARALESGWLAFPVGEPEAAVLGRFLVRTDAPVSLLDSLGSLLTGGRATSPALAAHLGGAAVIFPPGFPALLAVGFALGAPLAVGPAIAAALVLATAWLGSAVERRLEAPFAPSAASSPRQGQAPPLAQVAAIFSALSPALRYHTADTMAHGLAALCFTVALAATLGAIDHESRSSRAGLSAVAGLALGWLVATRPVSALVLAGCMLALAVLAGRRAAGPRRWRRALGASLVGGLAAGPGVLLWLAHQQAATGSPWGSAQTLYYALSDGPAGCFRYGFGSSVGCLGEHGTFVGHALPNGYGIAEALGTTARRLQHHLADALGFAPLFLLVPLGAWLGRSVGVVRLLGLGVLGQLFAYAPFYFDGNYPGGGARMLADVLPLEHVLAAVALRLLARRAPANRPSGRWLAGMSAACVLGGFALGSGADHAQLRERDGGAPMLEPSLVRSAVGSSGGGAALVLVGTDHGLNLGLDPAEPNDGGASGGPLVRRYRGDGLDRLTWEALGRPPAYRYHFEPTPPGATPSRETTRYSAWLTPLAFDARPTAHVPLRIEAESLWPAREQQGAWAWPVWRGAVGASGDGWLRVTVDRATAGATPDAMGMVRLALPSQRLGGRPLALRVRLGEDPLSVAASVACELAVVANETLLWRQSIAAAAGDEGPTGWVELEAPPLPEDLVRLELQVRAARAVELDYLQLGPAGRASAGPDRAGPPRAPTGP